jgi:hypothetical protein
VLSFALLKASNYLANTDSGLKRFERRSGQPFGVSIKPLAICFPALIKSSI